MTDRAAARATGTSLRRWVAYAAALWAAVFAVFHVIWAAGWYPLLNAEGARLAFSTPARSSPSTLIVR